MKEAISVLLFYRTEWTRATFFLRLMMTHSNFSGIRPLFGHPEHMLHLAQRVGIDAEIGPSAYSLLNRLFQLFQAVSSKKIAKGYQDMGWDAGQCQILRVTNATLADNHGVTVRTIQRLLRKLHDAGLIALHQVDAYHREIDLRPLFQAATNWHSAEAGIRKRRLDNQRVRNQIQQLIARYATVLNALRSEYAAPAKSQHQVLEDLTTMEALRLAYGECQSFEDYATLETEMATAEASIKRLEEVMTILREAAVFGRNETCEHGDNVVTDVEKDIAVVDNNGVFVSPPTTNLSSPHDSDDTQYTHTTPHMRVNSIEKGDRMFTAAPRRMRSINKRKETTQRKGGVSAACPDSWDIAWGLALKLRPEWKRAMGSCRTQEEYLRWITHAVPVAARALDDALEHHTTIDILGAFVVAASREASEIFACHSNHREERGRAIYAAGMLRKMPGGDQFDPEHPDHYLRPWPSVYGLLNNQGMAA